MKIIVDELPKRSRDCLYAELPQYEVDSKVQPLPNCQLKCNTFPMTDGFPFSYAPNRFTCSLDANKVCPYLKTGIVCSSK